MTFNQRVNLEIPEGTSYSKVFNIINESTGLPVDLTGCSAYMTVRKGYSGVNEPEAGLVFDSGPEGGISLGGAEGTVTISIDYLATEGLYWDKGVYDIVLFPIAGGKLRVAQGLFTIIPTSTRQAPTSPVP